MDHKKEAVVVIIKPNKNLEVVLADLNIIDRDRKGNPIRQGNTFMRTQRKFEDKEMKKIEEHLLTNKKRSRSVRNFIKANKEKFGMK